MEKKKSVRPQGGWREDEIALLLQSVKDGMENGRPLRDVFAETAQKLHRKPNSIRNFYYARLRETPSADMRNTAFRTFTMEEQYDLLRNVLIARGKGESVRACVTRMAGGDREKMLRYQNKYRSILKNHPDMLEAVATRLRAEGQPCPENATGQRTYASEMAHPKDAVEKALSLSESLKDDSLLLLVSRLSLLYQRLEAAENYIRNQSGDDASATLGGEASSANLSITFTNLRGTAEEEDAKHANGNEYYERWMDTRREVIRLRVQADLLRMHLAEMENQYRAEINLLRDTMDEFLALPKESRVKELDSFIRRAEEILKALDMKDDRPGEYIG